MITRCPFALSLVIRSFDSDHEQETRDESRYYERGGRNKGISIAWDFYRARYSLACWISIALLDQSLDLFAHLITRCPFALSLVIRSFDSDHEQETRDESRYYEQGGRNEGISMGTPIEIPNVNPTTRKISSSYAVVDAISGSRLPAP